MKIVILTCEKYTWMIPLFYHFLNKYWPHCPYKTEIVADAVPNLDIPFSPHTDSVFYTEGVSWSSGILNYIKQSKDDKFLLTPEDYILKSPVNTDRVLEAEALCTGSVGCVRLNAPDKYFVHTKDVNIKGFKEYPLDRSYSMSMQAAIWQRDYLIDVLRHGEDAWQAEIDGSKRLAVLMHKWRILWTTEAIWDYQAGGFMVAGRPRLDVVKWTIQALIEEIKQ